jgi:hypothetical protein
MAWDLGRLEIRDRERRGKRGNGNGLDAEFAKGAKFRTGELATAFNAEGAVVSRWARRGIAGEAATSLALLRLMG